MILKVERAKQLSEKELRLIYQLILSTKWGEYLESYQRFTLAVANSIPYVIYYNNEWIGFLRLVSDEVTFAYIMDFVIRPQYRKRGIGSNVLATIVNKEQYAGLTWLIKSTHAKGFYLKNGFKEISVDKYAFFNNRS